MTVRPRDCDVTDDRNTSPLTHVDNRQPVVCLTARSTIQGQIRPVPVTALFVERPNGSL
jgi:hypothetical protein